MWQLSATEVVKKLRNGDVSPLEVMDVAIARVTQVDAKINALPIQFFDEARAIAKKFKNTKKKHPGWLAGLPIAIKDYNDVAGQLTTYGSPIFANNRPTKDDRTVATIRLQGGIPFAKSNVPEFAGSHTFNPVWGVTRNPWNLSKTAGGSSGGAAASLASGETWLANGSCLGGSLRIPASFCGIVGMRPSPGIIPRGDGLAAFDSLWVEGPLARNVSDIALMLDTMGLFSIHDPYSRPVPLLGFQSAMMISGPPKRIGFSTNLGLRSIDPEVAAICSATVHGLKDLNCTIDEDIPSFADSIECFQVLRALLFAELKGDLLQSEKLRINPDIVLNIEKGFNLQVSEIISANKIRNELFHRMALFFENHDLLICPTVAVSPFSVDQRFPTEINGEKLSSYIDWMFLTFVITLFGCPAISIPCGLNKEGMPIGLQLIGRPNGDAQLLGFARIIEKFISFDASFPFKNN
jgi:amidase